MTVGYVIRKKSSGSLKNSSSPGLRLRLLSNIGRYPKGSICKRAGTYHFEDKLAFVAILTNEKRNLGYWSEVTFFALEEVRFLAAIVLSTRPDHGLLRIYPGGAYLLEETSDLTSLVERARNIAFGESGMYRDGSLPILGGAPYEVGSQTIDEKLFANIIARISIRDHLLLRGLGAILKADMLRTYREFDEEAQFLLYLALDAVFQMVLRLLRKRGNVNPSAFDAGHFIFSSFPNETPGRRFFEDYYDDRIKAFHASSRLGAFAYPPINADDYIGLRAGLICVFLFLITEKQWDNFWN